VTSSERSDTALAVDEEGWKDAQQLRVLLHGLPFDVSLMQIRRKDMSHELT